MKLLCKIILSCLILIQAFSFTNATETYCSLEVVNCVETGSTIVLTVEYLANDVVRITRSARTSNSNDKSQAYSLIGTSFVNYGDYSTLQCDNDTWFIPFQGTLQAYAVDGETPVLSCECDATKTSDGCEVTTTPSVTSKCTDTEYNPCSGCCVGSIVLPGPEPQQFLCYGIFVNAADILLVDDLD